MPSTTSRVVSIDLPSSTVMTPSLPTLSIASAIILPMVSSPLALMCPPGRSPSCPGSAWSASSSSTRPPSRRPASMPRLSSIGLAPAATLLQALDVDRLGEHGRGGGAVAGHVGGLGGDLLDHLRAHVLVLVLELDLLGDGDAVLGDGRGAPGLLSRRRCGRAGRG
jgi:hypothetical protein